MGLHAIEAAPKDGNPVFPVDQDTGDTTIVHWAVRQGVALQREGVPIAVSSTHWRPGSKSVEGSRKSGSFVARASVAAGACILWLFVGAVEDKALCSESNAHANAFVAPTEKEKKTPQPRAMRDESSLVSPIIETTVVEQTQSFERGRENIDILADRLISIQRSDAAHGKAAQAVQSAPAWERKQPLQFGQEWGKAEVLGCALTSSLRAELDAVRSAAEAARIEQKQALDQERDRTNALARELSSLWAELDAARFVGLEAVRAAEAEQALEQERGRADDLARELTSLQAELGTARAAGSQAAEAESKQRRALEQERDGLARELTSLRGELAAAQAAGSQAAETESKQKQTLDQALGQERDKREALARELTSLKAELDTMRAAHLETALTAEAAKIEQQKALKKEREKFEALSHELASARKEAEERSARLAAAHAEEVRVTETNSTIAAEHKLALANERDRADSLARELTSVKNELEASDREIATLRALRAPPSRGSVAESSQERIAESSSRTIDRKGRSPEQISGNAAALDRQRTELAAEIEKLRQQATADRTELGQLRAQVSEAARAPPPDAAALDRQRNELAAGVEKLRQQATADRAATAQLRTQVSEASRVPLPDAAALDRQRTELVAEIEKLRQDATIDRATMAHVPTQAREASR